MKKNALASFPGASIEKNLYLFDCIDSICCKVSKVVLFINTLTYSSNLFATILNNARTAIRRSRKIMNMYNKFLMLNLMEIIYNYELSD